MRTEVRRTFAGCDTQVLALRRFGRSNSSDTLLRLEAMPNTTSVTLGGLPPHAVSLLVAHVFGENVVSVHERLLEKCAHHDRGPRTAAQRAHESNAGVCPRGGRAFLSVSGRA